MSSLPLLNFPIESLVKKLQMVEHWKVKEIPKKISKLKEKKDLILSTF
jgi:hypothetical protein